MAQPDADFQLRCQIIEEVKERPLLYNKGHPKYQINSCQTGICPHQCGCRKNWGVHHRFTCNSCFFIPSEST